MKTNKNLNYYFTVFTTILIVVLFSCSKDELKEINFIDNVFDHVTLKDGALCFDSAKYASILADTLLKMPIKFKQEWEKSIGFVPMNKVIDEFYQKIDLCETQEEVNEILLEYSDVVKDDDDDVTYIIPLDFHRSIINREGIYYVRKSLVKITPDSKIVIWSGDKTKLNNIGNELKSKNIHEEELNIISDDIVITKYFNTINLKSNDVLGHELYGDREHEKRKIKFWIRAWRNDWGDHVCLWNYSYEMEIKIENLKKGLFKWKPYGTSCRFEGVDVMIKGPKIINTNSINCSSFTVSKNIYDLEYKYFLNYSYSSPSQSAHSEYHQIGVTIKNNPLPLPVFEVARGKATNRGIGDRYAGICYGQIICHNLN